MRSPPGPGLVGGFGGAVVISIPKSLAEAARVAGYRIREMHET